MDKWPGEQNGGNHCCRKEYRKNNEKSEDGLWDAWDNMKPMSSHITGVLEGEEREKGSEKIFEEIIAENLPKTEKEIVNQVQEVQSPRQDKPK